MRAKGIEPRFRGIAEQRVLVAGLRGSHFGSVVRLQKKPEVIWCSAAERISACAGLVGAIRSANKAKREDAMHTLVPSDRVERVCVYGRDGARLGSIERLM